MKNKRDYAVFILSHERVNDIKTDKMLKKQGYSGEWFIVIDDKDNQIDEYKEKYGDKLIIFSKEEVDKWTDTCDMDNDMRVGVYARNFIKKEASSRGYKYHLQLDDDFSQITYRYIKGKKLKVKPCENLDRLFDAIAEYLDETEITWISFGLSSYYIGGVNKNFEQGMIRKTMGSFFCNTEKMPDFLCRMNDDITTNILYTSRGHIMFTLMAMQVETPPTQQMDGGMTDIYQENGTYRKSFYSVMVCPSFVKVSQQGIKDKRVHHETNWKACAPMILNQKWRKKK